MSTSSARVYPEDVLETEVFTETSVNHFDSHGHESPAFVAYVCFVATSADFIIIRQIEIEDKLFRDRPKGSGFAKTFAVTGVC